MQNKPERVSERSVSVHIWLLVERERVTPRVVHPSLVCRVFPVEAGNSHGRWSLLCNGGNSWLPLLEKYWATMIFLLH